MPELLGLLGLLGLLKMPELLELLELPELPEFVRGLRPGSLVVLSDITRGRGVIGSKTFSPVGDCSISSSSFLSASTLSGRSCGD